MTKFCDHFVSSLIGIATEVPTDVEESFMEKETHSKILIVSENDIKISCTTRRSFPIYLQVNICRIYSF